jgi:hypothetical protein
VAGLGQQVVVDVDHPADDPLEQPFGDELVRRARQVVGQRLSSQWGKVGEVSDDEQRLARHELGVDH